MTDEVPDEVPKLEISHQDGGDKEVQRDKETEGSGGVGQRDVQSNDLLIFHLDELRSDLSWGEPAANNEEEDAEDQHDEEADHPEEEASHEDREVLPSIPHSVVGPHDSFLIGNWSRLGINNLSEERITTEF